MIRKHIRSIDRSIFSSRLESFYVKASVARRVLRANDPGFYRIYTEYEKNADCELARLFEFYGSDKGFIDSHRRFLSWPSHSYSDFYSKLFWQSRGNVRKVFECGIGSNNPSIPSNMGVSGKPGASLRAWRDFFPNAEIFGSDIDSGILFDEERIRTFEVDQLDSSSIKRLWNRLNVRDFDLMIDDGLHTFQAASTLFAHSVDKLSVNGFYIIEDVKESDILLFRDFFSAWDVLVDFVHLFRSNTVVSNNNLILIRKKSNKVRNI